jgi:hypothetical protein
MTPMRCRSAVRALVTIQLVLLSASTARSGHEQAVYPSYYPHEIAIEAMAAERAAILLRQSRIQAYIGREPAFDGGVPPDIRAVESLGSFVVLRLNPDSPRMQDHAAACTAVRAVLRAMAGGPSFVFHPYPVTPFQGDYLEHADLAAAAKARVLATPLDGAPPPRVLAEGATASMIRPEWRTGGGDWDVAIELVSAKGLMAAAMDSINGWIGPPWLKSGWFYADRILSDAIEDTRTRQQADAARVRLESSGEQNAGDRINLARQLVTALTRSCRKAVAGYTVAREYFSAEFTAGVENIGFDSISGLNSPMFVRTVKLKDFPWNGWLALGIDGKPEAAWNPVAGFTDPFGQLLWSAIGDPALIPAPYDAGWMLNRAADVRANTP